MDLTRHLAETRGFFTRAEALDAGHDDRDLTRGVRRGHLVRFRHGSYTFPDLWLPLDDAGRHRVRARSALHGMRGQVALSHTSAALAHQMTTWGVDLARVHVTRLDGGVGRIDGDVVHHEGLARPDEVVLLDGVKALSASRCAIETASLGTPESALVVLDSFLHRGLGTHAELLAQFRSMQHWPRTRHLHVPVRMADGGADGPGESRGRWLFRQAGLPCPVLQHPVHTADGHLAGISDWAWPREGLLGEFDGEAKYGRLVPAGTEVGDVVFAEKMREDRLREITGWSMVRLVWEDLARPRQTAERIRRLMRDAV